MRSTFTNRTVAALKSIAEEQGVDPYGWFETTTADLLEAGEFDDNQLRYVLDSVKTGYADIETTEPVLRVRLLRL